MKTKVKIWALAGILLSALCTVDSGRATAQVPAPRRVIVVPRAPVARQVWVPGHYVRRGRDYLWVNGYYRAAPVRYTAYSKPARYKTWNPGYWRKTHRGPVWVKGYWSY
ncbi:YXWGXW repeat-containing protein [Spirosoma terrae]|uniref:BcpO-related WXXGXW repeat protein n=1 Tax=Spirosoma terrae TaxID=1968276 RepID=A0A6L9LCN2_9BACT|nr:YXWGXW repeat-containing protein [Spirosoma terrae]NDU98325.1 BcpO-related WXXGXW repeat protein [Spirosoma terrae]